MSSQRTVCHTCNSTETRTKICVVAAVTASQVGTVCCDFRVTNTRADIMPFTSTAQSQDFVLLDYCPRPLHSANKEMAFATMICQLLHSASDGIAF